MFRLRLIPWLLYFMTCITSAYAYDHQEDRDIINYIGNEILTDEYFVMYDEYPFSKWENLYRENNHEPPKIRKRFYGKDISFEFESDNGVIFECKTPVPTFFWNQFLIRSKGEIIICEEKNIISRTNNE